MKNIYDIYEGVFDDDDTILSNTTSIAIRHGLKEDVFKVLSKSKNPSESTKKRLIEKVDTFFRTYNLIPKEAIVCWDFTKLRERGYKTIVVFRDSEHKKNFEKYHYYEPPIIEFNPYEYSECILDHISIDRNMSIYCKEYYNRLIKTLTGKIEVFHNDEPKKYIFMND